MFPAKLAPLLVMLTLAAGAAPARAETVTCTAVTSLPFVITVQGIYCFKADQTTNIASGNAIDIQTNNVVLDLNGFKLGGLAAGPGTTTIGIHALNRQNITIKNGTIRGFLGGIFLENSAGSQGHLVENIRADQNTSVGIQVEGAGCIVRNNQVVATGGTTIGGGTANAWGILVSGAGSRVLNNDVINTVKQGGGTTAVAIQFATASVGGLAVNNRLTVADKGIEFAGTATGKYRDNLTFGIATPFTGGTVVGTND